VTSTAEKDNHSIPVMARHILAMLFAAHTNTAATTAWTIAHVVKDKELLDKVLEEVNQVTMQEDKEEGRVGHFIKQLPYLDACMKEVTRKYGMLSLIRKASKEVTIKDYVLPKGRLVLVSPYVAHHDPEVFSHPEKFWPQRFIDPEEKNKLISERHYVQFGYGTHHCLGERFANTVTKTIWTVLFRNYNVEVLNDELPRYDPSRQTGTPFAGSPIWVKITPRI